MADLVVVVPSRGRPDAAAELSQAFQDTTTADTGLVFVVDDNDETGPQYEQAIEPFGDRVAVLFTPARTMVQALNLAAVAYANVEPKLAFMGDDHRPRTVGFDTEYVKALDDLGTGIVYGNDLLQGRNLATQCAMTADIVSTLGFMAPPGLRHMYCDNFWMELGNRLGRLRYLPDVVVEHVHPIAQNLPREQWSDGHLRVNAPEVYGRDRAEFGRYLSRSMSTDMDKLKSLVAS